MVRMNEIELADRITKAKLATQHRPHLEWLVKTINQGMSAIADKLKEIKDGELWKYDAESFNSFEDFCRARFDIGRRRVQQLLHAEGVRQELADQVEEPEVKKVLEVMPERQARALADVPKEKRMEALRTVVRSGKVITGAEIKRAAGIETKAKQVCPHCHQTF